MVSDFGHPWTRGEGVKGQIFADVLYGWPQVLCIEIVPDAQSNVKWNVS